jgi:hypothetical protein
VFGTRRPCTTQQPPYWAAGPRISPLFLSLLSANTTVADSAFLRNILLHLAVRRFEWKRSILLMRIAHLQAKWVAPR